MSLLEQMSSQLTSSDRRIIQEAEKELEKLMRSKDTFSSYVKKYNSRPIPPRAELY